jgi:hypothetical protein
VNRAAWPWRTARTLLTTAALCAIAAVATFASVAAPPQAAAFLPSRHGFVFVNHFSGSVLSRSFGLASDMVQMSGFGLCGGMSFAAADYFAAGRPVPSEASQPAEGTALREYLHRRQMDSLGGLAAGLPQVARFTSHMRAPDLGAAGTRVLSAAQLDSVVSQLQAGRLVMLGLVYVRTAGNKQDAAGPVGQPWENHQVLAYAAARPTQPGEPIRIRIYDPNFPGDDSAALVIEPGLAGSLPSIGPLTVHTPLLGVRMTRIAARPAAKAGAAPTVDRKLVRSMFTMPYTPAQPPN